MECFQQADINGDGMDDIICDDLKGHHFARLSNGDGTFRDLGKIITGWCAASNMYTMWADVDGDKKADIICSNNHAATHYVKLSRGDGTFKKDLGRV